MTPEAVINTHWRGMDARSPSRAPRVLMPFSSCPHGALMETDCLCRR